MIYCLECHGKTEVYASESSHKKGFKRYRRCLSCLAKFVSFEVIQTAEMKENEEREKQFVKVSKREYEAFTKVMQAAKHSIHLMR
jgi:transcriptional regulator NrdR family protein